MNRAAEELSHLYREDALGKTPWEHARTLWANEMTPARVDSLKDTVGSTVDHVRDSIEGKKTPRERHSLEDKKAVDQLVAKRALKGP